MNRFAEALGFGVLLAAAVVGPGALLYHDLAPVYLRPALVIGGVSPLIAGTVSWWLVGRLTGRADSRHMTLFRRAAGAGALAAFLTAALGTALYASPDLAFASLFFVGVPLTVPAVILGGAYALLLRRIAGRPVREAPARRPRPGSQRKTAL